MAGPMVTYIADTHELRSCPDYFRDKGAVPNTISWTIEPGGTVTPGKSLGTIQWPGNQKEQIVAPDDCGGTVTVRNDRVYMSDLLNEPQTLLRF